VIADPVLGVFVHANSVTAAHMRGRHREGKPTDLFGRRWRVESIREVDERLLVMLEPLPREGPIMCSGCGSFELDRVQRGDPWHCTACHRRDREPGILLRGSAPGEGG
jgi:ribosomal protein L37AE/L43A